MIKAAMEYFKEQTRLAIIQDGDGREFFADTNNPVIPSIYQPLEINTLTGINDWFASEDYCEGSIIHVVDERNVLVITPPDTEWLLRGTHLSSHHSATEFRFNEFMGVEQFIISLQCHFEESTEKTSIIDFASKVDGAEIKTSEDSGIAQTVTIKDGISGRAEYKDFNPIITLAPRRTFTEIKQPTSPFLLRLQKNRAGNPEFALFDADGGQWKNKAIRDIKAYLAASPAIADKKADILA